MPTSAKNADRKALRCGVAPIPIMWLKAWISIPRKVRPNRPVRASQPSVACFSLSCMATTPWLLEKEAHSSRAVLSATSFRSKMSAPEKPVA